ncbi:MAG: hypothetical protein EOM22_15645 [Gammaproteobacteria bacterium]|nr:hypothetical protein [Gammaproteobacteria bacterium]
MSCPGAGPGQAQPLRQRGRSRRHGPDVRSEALPKGILTQDEAGLLMRALALSQGAEAVPDALLRDLAADVARFVSDQT